MVTHKRLQRYKHYYGKACYTGLFGCRWHRYQQSRDDTSKRDLVWLAVTIGTFFFMLFWFYYWLVAENSHDNINRFLIKILGHWYNWYYLFVVLSSLAFAYMFLLMLLILFHVASGQEIYMHWVHKVLVVLCDIFGIVSIAFLEEYWPEGWSLISLSFQTTGMFLQILAVVVMTALSWFIVGYWISIDNLGAKITYLAVYVMLMVWLYACPLLIYSSCIREGGVPDKPLVLAHKGASSIAPENTKIAFKYALERQNVIGVECDITISWDGVPFLNHDETLKRTTNVEDVFPDRANAPAIGFTMSDLKQLDTGSFFLKDDPFGTVHHLTEQQKAIYRNQTVMTLEELLVMVKEYNKSIMVDIQNRYDSAIEDTHPYYYDMLAIIEKTILRSGIQPHRVLWVYGGINNNFTAVSSMRESAEYLQMNNISSVNVGFDAMKWSWLREYQQDNISSNIYTIDSRWLYSLYWCAGLESVTSNAPDNFVNMSGPAWIMSRSLQVTVWVVVDVLSALVIIAIFVVQIRRRAEWGDEETTKRGMEMVTTRIEMIQRRPIETEFLNTV